MQFVSSRSLKYRSRCVVFYLALLAGLAALTGLALGGCSGLSASALPTLMPTDFLPTAIALTAQAGAREGAGAGESASPQANPPAAASETPSPPAEALPSGNTTPPPTAMLTGTPDGTTATPYTLPPSATPTAISELPESEIQILNLGSLSRVTSPIPLSAYMKTGGDGRVVVELLGEDRRVLFREVKNVRTVPAGSWVPLKMAVDYEISAAAEAGRLQIYVADQNKRTTALSSIPLILLSIGDDDIYPPQDRRSPIVIQSPRKKALIQGGTVQVSGLVRGDPDQPLMVRLILPDGSEAGARLANVTPPEQGAYSAFEVEVPYTVSKAVRALLTVSQGEAGINDVVQLTSVEVMLSP
jgi:hypothetical protein